MARVKKNNGQTYKTSYGLEYNLLTPEQWEKKKGGMMPYDRSVGDMHIRNYGYAITNAKVGDIIDDEYDLAEIGKQIKQMPKRAATMAQAGSKG